LTIWVILLHHNMMLYKQRVKMENEIKLLREKTGLSQSEFAKKYHISVKTVQNWEQGFRKPPEYAVYLLSQVIEQKH